MTIGKLYAETEERKLEIQRLGSKYEVAPLTIDQLLDKRLQHMRERDKMRDGLTTASPRSIQVLYDNLVAIDAALFKHSMCLCGK